MVHVMDDFISLKILSFGIFLLYYQIFHGLRNTFSIRLNSKAGMMRLHTGLSLAPLSVLGWRAVLTVPMSLAEEEICSSGHPGRGRLCRDSSSLPGIRTKSHEGICFTCPLEAGEEQLLFSCSSITSHN